MSRRLRLRLGQIYLESHIFDSRILSMATSAGDQGFEGLGLVV